MRLNPNNFKILSHCERFILLGNVNDGSVYLQLFLQAKEGNQFIIYRTFTKNVMLGLNEELRLCFGSIYNVAKYLTDIDNYEVNEKTGQILMLVQDPQNKSQKNVVAKIKLDQKKLDFQ